MSKKGSSLKDALQNAFAVSAIFIAFIIAYYLFTQIMGNPVNFEGHNPKGQPIQGNYLGIIYKGGYIVPILMTCVLTLIIFHIRKNNHPDKGKRKRQIEHIRPQTPDPSC